MFELDGRATPLGWVIPGRANPQLRPLPAQRGRSFRARAEQGPSIEPATDPWNRTTGKRGGLRSAATRRARSIRYDSVVGVLTIDGAGALEEAALTDDVPALVDCADLAGVLIGREVGERREIRHVRERIHAIIAATAFRPVFQPIVDMQTDILGYEALTRFSDDVSPDTRFAEALSVRAGIDLEIAQRSRWPRNSRPPAGWGVAQPERLAGPHPGRAQPGPPPVGCDRPQLSRSRSTHRDGLRGLPHLARPARPNVRLAVDDAGAGFASLRHMPSAGVG